MLGRAGPRELLRGWHLKHVGLPLDQQPSRHLNIEERRYLPALNAT